MRLRCYAVQTTVPYRSARFIKINEDFARRYTIVLSAKSKLGIIHFRFILCLKSFWKNSRAHQQGMLFHMAKHNFVVIAHQ